MLSSYTINVNFQRDKQFLIKHNYKVIWSFTIFHNSTRKNMFLSSQRGNPTVMPTYTHKCTYINTNVRTGGNLWSEALSWRSTSPFRTLAWHPDSPLPQSLSCWIAVARARFLTLWGPRAWHSDRRLAVGIQLFVSEWLATVASSIKALPKKSSPNK